MRLLITGANGFLGSYVVVEALRRGHHVRALVRPATELSKRGWHSRDGVEIARADLRARQGLDELVAGVDCVIHLAAAKSGDLYVQYAGTVVATENLLGAMDRAGVRGIVAISSLAVYDYLHLRAFSVLNEDSPIERDAFDRDEYAHTKLVQERLIRGHAARNNWDYVVLRPGVIWGRDNWFTARLGVQATGRLWIRTGGFARLPLTYVENCAEAIVMAAESRAVSGQTLNVIDDEQPTQGRFARLLRRRVAPRPIMVPVPFILLRMISGLAWAINRRFFAGRVKIPGLLVPARLHARCKPLRYSNQRIRTVLGWKARYGLRDALNRTFFTPPPTRADLDIRPITAGPARRATPMSSKQAAPK